MKKRKVAVLQAMLAFGILPLGSVLAFAQGVAASPGSLSWGSVRVGNTSGVKSVTLTNGQTSPLAIHGISLPLGSDFIQPSTTCPVGSTLAAGSSCVISVGFRPLAQGARTSQMTILDDAPSGSTVVPLSGTGVVGPLLYSPTSLTFSNVAPGSSSAAQSATLTNTTSGAVTLSGFTTGAQFAQTNDCPLSPGTLAAGASCTLNVTFNPTQAGFPTAMVQAAFQAAGSNSAVDLYLTGSTGQSAITLSPASYDFGTEPVGTSSGAEVFTVANPSGSPVTISSVSVSPSDFAVASSCPASPATLASGNSCTVSVTFTPAAAGTRTGTLTIADSGSSTPATASLTGTGSSGTPLGSVTFTPASLSWGSVAVGSSSGAKSLTLTNNQSSALTISSLSVGSDFSIQSTTCPTAPATLAANGTCTISIVFDPLATGARADRLTVADNGTNSPQTAALSGTGVLGPVLFAPTSVNFPATNVGSVSAPQSVNLSNTQSSTAVSITGFTVSGPFAQTNTCPSSLAANASCTLSVTYNPTAAGNQTGGVYVHTGTGVYDLALSGTGGTSGGSAAVTLSPASYAFPSQAPGSQSSPVSFTLTNNQSVALSISSISVSNSAFLETNTCGATLAAGANCTISVSFAPASTGSQSGVLSVTDNVAGSPQTVSLSGTGASGSGSGSVAITPKTGGLGFYHQIVNTASTPLPVTITNNGSSAVNISGLNSTPDFPFTSNCIDASGSGSLSGGASCTIQVTSDPQSLGTVTANLTFAVSGSGTVSIPLAGYGIPGDAGPTVTVEPWQPCILPGHTQQFTALVSNTSSSGLNWFVDGHPGGNSGAGTITSGGLYTAPSATGTHTIQANNLGGASAYGSTTISLTSTPAFAIYPFTVDVQQGAQYSFQAQMCNVPDTNPVSWSVDNIAGGNATVGTVSSTGVYTAPATGGRHIVRVTDAVLGKTSGAVVNVFGAIAVDFGSRASTSYPVPANMFGFGRAESLHGESDSALLTAGGLTTARLYAPMQTIFASQTPNWSSFDASLTLLQSGGAHVMLQMLGTPPSLQPTSGTCEGNYLATPTNLTTWGNLAAQVVAHVDTKFPGLVQDYEIWNEPNAADLCSGNHLNDYIALYAAGAPAIKQQAAADGQTIRVGGPVASGYSPSWFTTLLSNSSTAPYVDFVSYHEYLFGTKALQVAWDSYNGNTSIYQYTQDPSVGASAIFNKVHNLVAAGQQPGGANTPIYVTEYNTNFAFDADCCRNDPTYGPLWNALYVGDMLNSVYGSAGTMPTKLVYFAGSAYPYFCLLGVWDQNMDCLYSAGATPQPYPQYYTYQLLASPQYLGLAKGGYMAASVNPAAGSGGIAVTGFYDSVGDGILIVNPTATDYTAVQITANNTGLTSPAGTLYQIAKGQAINSSTLALTQSGSSVSASIAVPAYSVQAILLKGQ